MNKLSQFAAKLAVGAAILTLPTTPATADTVPQIFPPPPPTVCHFIMTSLTAENLQNDGGTDNVFLGVGGTRFPTTGTVAYSAPGQTQPAAAFDNPQGAYARLTSLNVSLRLLGSNVPIATKSIPCSTVSDAVRTFSNGDATYTMRYNVFVESLEP
ncbi:MAG TPA: hypothetical protein VGX25_18625 [Actinophytocola sp.]|uniref:hypothetical protein n=1 Tax=Actinophytocola sp. TaxID=1872138 RepID=UPI002DDCCEA1|nr:hypothetical protein [Actinophytocola sp.]HEV2781401.1 hypothetical protein [Actinophytocola sp.]